MKKILEKTPPLFMVAIHQHGLDANLYPKKIQINLSKLENKVEVEFKIMKSMSERVNTRSIFFRKLIEDYYRYIGINVDNDILERIYPEEVLNNLIKKNLYVILILFFPITVLFFDIFRSWFLDLVVVVGFSGLSFPSVKGFLKYIKLRNHLY